MLPQNDAGGSAVGVRRSLSPIARAFTENEQTIKRVLARYLPRGRDVEDLAQETFLRAFAAEATHEVAQPRAFLFTTARNLALNESARRAHAVTRSMEDFAAPDVLGCDLQPTGDDQLHSRQKLAAFAEALSALPDQCRRVFTLRKVYGLSQKEVAAALEISESTVEKQVAMGLLRTREFLRGRGFEVGQASEARPPRAISRTGSADG
jgi:RNA polymerase sigma-70 factor (ECF subfamily)